MHSLKIGDTYTSTLTVEDQHTAAAFGSGDILVFSTPMMVGLMENAALSCAAAGLEDGWSTVGISLDIRHMAATPVGFEVRAVATLEAIEGKQLTFKVEAFDDVEKVGEGTHKRYIVDGKSFVERAMKKSKS